jgi:hypothetical protein
LLQPSIIERRSKIILSNSFSIFAIIFVITTPVIIAIINAEVEVGGQAGHVQSGPAEGVGMDGEAGPDVEQGGDDGHRGTAPQGQMKRIRSTSISSFGLGLFVFVFVFVFFFVFITCISMAANTSMNLLVTCSCVQVEHQHFLSPRPCLQVGDQHVPPSLFD